MPIHGALPRAITYRPFRAFIPRREALVKTGAAMVWEIPASAGMTELAGMTGYIVIPAFSLVIPA